MKNSKQIHKEQSTFIYVFILNFIYIFIFVLISTFIFLFISCCRLCQHETQHEMIFKWVGGPKCLLGWTVLLLVNLHVNAEMCRTRLGIPGYSHSKRKTPQWRVIYTESRGISVCYCLCLIVPQITYYYYIVRFIFTVTVRLSCKVKRCLNNTFNWKMSPFLWLKHNRKVTFDWEVTKCH